MQRKLLGLHRRAHRLCLIQTMHQTVRKALRHGKTSQENVDRRARVLHYEPQSGIRYFFGCDYFGGFHIFFLLFGHPSEMVVLQYS